MSVSKERGRDLPGVLDFQLEEGLTERYPSIHYMPENSMHNINLFCRMKY